MDVWKLFKVSKPKHDTAVVVLVENCGELSTRIGYYRPNQIWCDRCNNRIQGVVAWWKPPTAQMNSGSVRWNFEQRVVEPEMTTRELEPSDPMIVQHVAEVSLEPQQALVQPQLANT